MSFDKNSPQPLKVRALKALAASDIEPDARSAITERGDVLFLSDSSEADARGAEFIFAFPSERVPETLDMETEFLIDGRPILAGVTTTELYANKQLLTPTSEWTTLCEDLCERYAYVERSIALSGERRLSRRFFLAYNESFMLIFDELDGTSLDAKSVPQFRARSVFPFNTARNVQTDAEAREIALVRRANGAESNPNAAQKTAVKTSLKKKSTRDEIPEETRLLEELANAPEKDRLEPFVRLFPLCLPEWRADASRGDFTATENGLELTATRSGTCLTSALLIDFNARRAARPCTWRKLTVGEKLEPVDEDRAVGRKLRLGQEQYVFYASTSPYPAIRSILSRNLLSDFMVGKFTAKRGVAPIVDVEIE